MQTIITYPADAGYQQKLTVIEDHTVGAKVLDSYGTLTGSRLVFAVSRDGLYLVYVHGSGYHRLSVTDDKGGATRMLELLKEVHGIASEAIG
jgi:hypothetical protein|nr:MAG TPA: hypothetical protein [Caudoviricetes sp.]